MFPGSRTSRASAASASTSSRATRTDAFHDREAEVLAQRLVDDVRVALAGPDGADASGA
jgi:hypothetical protein